VSTVLVIDILLVLGSGCPADHPLIFWVMTRSCYREAAAIRVPFGI